jgi:hypothetical protein
MAPSRSSIVHVLEENPDNHTLRESVVEFSPILEIQIVDFSILDADNSANVAISISEFSVGE